MASASWLNGWLTGDLVTAAEFRKGMGCIADTTLGADAASVDFSGLPTSYAHMLIVFYGRSTTAATTAALGLRFNNDSTGSYYTQGLRGNAAVASAFEALASSTAQPAIIPAASVADATMFGTSFIWVPNYGGAYKKMAVSVSGAVTNTTSGNLYAETRFSWWNNSTAISRVTLLDASGGNLLLGTRVSVYAMGS